MPFTPGQWRDFRELREGAWKVECRRTGATLDDKSGKDLFFRSQLEIATGFRSTKQCNAGRHFDQAAAHFEILGDAGIKFQLRGAQSDAKRIAYLVRKRYPDFFGSKFSNSIDSFALYLQKIGASVTSKPETTPLLNYSDAEIRAITQAIHIHANRFQS